jgi:hypothetical protein
LDSASSSSEVLLDGDRQLGIAHVHEEVDEHVRLLFDRAVLQTCDPVLQVRTHRGPFAVDDAEDDRVPQAAVGHHHMLAQHAVLLGTQGGDRAA